jgi:hypothetical protein
MRRASLFLSLAAGLVASLALSAPAQAGSVLYDATSFVYVYTNTATDATVTFNQVVSGPVTILPATTLTGVTVLPIGPTDTSITFDFNPVGASPGVYKLDFTLYSTSGLVLQGGTVSGSPLPMGGVSGFVTPASVPEPASLALLGIGMTGFLAFRRFFKKTSVA